MTINELCTAAYEAAKAKGFHDKPRPIVESLCLIHSEISEALECDREGRRVTPGMPEYVEQLHNEAFVAFADEFRAVVKDTFEDELADIMIRVADLAGSMDIDLQKHIELKMKYNATRQAKHGKAY